MPETPGQRQTTVGGATVGGAEDPTAIWIVSFEVAMRLTPCVESTYTLKLSVDRNLGGVSTVSYAIIRSGGKQFRVSPGEIVRVPSISGKNEGDSVHFTDVLVAGGDSGLRIGAPTIDGAVVTGTIVKNGRGPKILVFKFKRRKGFKKMKGHRQDFTAVKIESIA